MRRSLITDTTADLIFHSALALSLYLLFAGHNQPGGGFVGGLVASAAVVTHYIAGGIDDVRAITRVAPWTILGGGLLLSAAAAIAPMAFGGSLLESHTLTLDLPVFGSVKAGSTLVFDAGVYGVVVGLTFMVLEAFGDEAAPEAEDPHAPEEADR